MNLLYLCAVVVAVVILAAVACINRDYLVPATTLSVRPGETYEDVVAGSTFPVSKHAVLPGKGSGATDVDAPTLVIVFNDSVNGFTLPPTKFAQITWRDGRVATITTSPMFEALPFDDAVVLVNQLQTEFRKAGWEPGGRSDERAPSWFDITSAAGLSELRQASMPEVRRGNTLKLVVSHRYAMRFSFRCWDYCAPAPNKYTLYRIDISISPDD
ncbi:hypothetical protein R75461_07470 [Paraburkholderia nemoris]|uniref:hypothetical protein n=1 Tax=Paraburkholderia nemoris TaxID=2793076 RepID=UPI00190B0494|nr:MULTISPECIES: hypothetical protein [Paraburkholderia]MBK3786339.1 hypothetical protein [Paraburkholderia aspalathi]CAE6851058.1 hypothetical protein R75461_07470 [Paraburkholderia nemoris]